MGFCWLCVVGNFPEESVFLADLGEGTTTTGPAGPQELLVVPARGVEPWAWVQRGWANKPASV